MDSKWKKEFAWFPIRIDDELIWFTHYKQHYQKQMVEDKIKWIKINRKKSNH